LWTVCKGVVGVGFVLALPQSFQQWL
jgi:hypothetical protein